MDKGFIEIDTEGVIALIFFVIFFVILYWALKTPEINEAMRKAEQKPVIPFCKQYGEDWIKTPRQVASWVFNLPLSECTNIKTGETRPK